ncbi:hypothetical protein ET445_01210 [Agromyces protaetiae]|uniref:DUF998 domain-containing protein n=1 Tax=Agromyces protaetiae TaxID=2509455 RepID=A0A4P6FNV3_9MICO|nr:hypothetical protein [Agromyces protaetiae]QAY72158.1 hypothetical protein ET445_01210 [Agromyces protaetiae]
MDVSDALARDPDRARDPDLSLRLWAFLAGGSGVVALVPLIGFFALGAPFAGTYTRWSWLGPANDALSIIVMPATAVFAVFVARRLRSRVAWVLTGLLVVAAGALVWATAAMLHGAVGFEVQFVVAVPFAVAMFAWTLVASRRAARRGMLGAGMSRWGVIMAVSALAGVALFGAGLLLGGVADAAETALLIAAGIPTAAAWLAFPVWCVALAYRWRSAARERHPPNQNFHLLSPSSIPEAQRKR